MNEIVYLYELDSICNTKKEMEYALDKALYEAIVLNGDKVALTFNQFADSVFIMSFLKNDRMRSVLIDLFKQHRIVISKYKQNDEEISSAVRYVIKQINRILTSGDENFVFSAIGCLNIDNLDQKLFVLSIIRDALIYNDIDFLYNKLNEYKNAGKIIINDEDMTLLKNYVEFLIEISLSDVEHLPCKVDKTYTLSDCIDIAYHAFQKSNEKLANEIVKLKEETFSMYKRTMQNRSAYVECINKTKESYSTSVEIVINVCYNMARESSISYINTLEKQQDKERLFIHNYEYIRNVYLDTGNKFFKTDSRSPKTYLYDFSKEQIEHWESALNIIKKIGDRKNKNNCNWENIVKKFRFCNKVNFVMTLILTILILYYSGIAIDYLMDGVNYFVRISSAILGIIAVILGDIVGYVLKVPNLIETFFDKQRKFVLKNYRNIVKHQLYNKEINYVAEKFE